jgi:hypothetical protein
VTRTGQGLSGYPSSDGGNAQLSRNPTPGSTEPSPRALVFAPWTDPAHATHLAANSTYSRVGWLPMLGANAWVLWGTLAAELADDPEVTWILDHLGRAHGLCQDSVERCLHRLERLRLATPTDEDHWLVRTTCPRLSTAQLTRLPGWVKSLHDRTFPPIHHPELNLAAQR